MGALEEASRDELIEEIRGLRRENASWRTKYREVASVFDNFDEPVKDGLLKLIDDLAKNPESAANVMRGVAYDILGDKIHEDAPWANADTDSQEEQETEEMDDELKAKIEKLEQMLEDLKGRSDAEAEAQKQAEEAEITRIIEEARALGYEEGTPEMTHLLFTAHHQFGGDLRKAAEKIAPITGIEFKGGSEDSEPEGGDGGGTGDDAGVSDEGEDQGGRRFPSTGKANAGTPKPPKAEAPQTFEEAEEAVYAFLDSLPD